MFDTPELNKDEFNKNSKKYNIKKIIMKTQVNIESSLGFQLNSYETGGAIQKSLRIKLHRNTIFIYEF